MTMCEENEDDEEVWPNAKQREEIENLANELLISGTAYERRLAATWLKRLLAALFSAEAMTNEAIEARRRSEANLMETWHAIVAKKSDDIRQLQEMLRQPEKVSDALKKELARVRMFAREILNPKGCNPTNVEKEFPD
jgi:DNA repair exonuclease SbcCD ATPase subunit